MPDQESELSLYVRITLVRSHSAKLIVGVGKEAGALQQFTFLAIFQN